MMRRIEIIAEVANAHQGSPETAQALARQALAAGADVVKFQVYLAEELLVERHPRFVHFRQLEFTQEVWKQLIVGVHAAGGRAYCDVFGLRALEIASTAGADGFKVHSSDLGNEPLLQALARQRRPVLLAVGGSTIGEISRAVAILKQESGIRPVLLHGFQSYPTAAEESRLGRLAWLRQLFGSTCDLGYMDHVDAEDPLSLILPLLTLGFGIRAIEKHITLDRQARGIDYYSSLNPDEFSRFISLVRRAEQAIGDDPEQFSASERRYRQQVKKHWVTVQALRKGEPLALESLTMKRAPAETFVPALHQLLGRTLRRDCPAEHVLSAADVSQQVWALVVVRMRSCRLPGKALVDVDGMPALAHLIERLKQATCIDRIVVCTTTEPDDDPLAQLATAQGVRVFRGPNEDVLRRMLGAIEGQQVDVVLRVTGDDIMVDPKYADRAVEHHLRVNAQYTSMKALPSGMEVEVFDAELLKTIAVLAKDSRGTEYLTSYVVRHGDQFRLTQSPVDPAHQRPWRLTLDTAEDLEVIRTFLKAMREQGKTLSYRLDDVVAYFAAHPEVLARNGMVRQRGLPAEVCVELDWQRLARRSDNSVVDIVGCYDGQSTTTP